MFGILTVWLRGRSLPWLVDRLSCSHIGNSDQILQVGWWAPVCALPGFVLAGRGRDFWGTQKRFPLQCLAVRSRAARALLLRLPFCHFLLAVCYVPPSCSTSALSTSRPYLTPSGAPAPRRCCGGRRRLFGGRRGSTASAMRSKAGATTTCGCTRPRRSLKSRRFAPNGGQGGAASDPPPVLAVLALNGKVGAAPDRAAADEVVLCALDRMAVAEASLGTLPMRCNVLAWHGRCCTRPCPPRSA